MYLTFEEYKQLGGKLDEATFAGYEAKSEVVLDNWTLNRLHNAQVQADLEQTGQNDKVKAVMAMLVDAMPSIEKARKSKADGTEVTSFNNGVNSFSFGGSQSVATNSAEQEAYRQACILLPVELVSACVSFNHAS